MDKPEILKVIHLHHPDISLKYIQDLANKELERQVINSVNGILKDKSKEILTSLLEYNVKPSNTKIKQ